MEQEVDLGVRLRQFSSEVFGRCLVYHRPLEFYLMIAGLSPKELSGKKVLNAGSGQSDLGRELEERWGVYSSVVNLDIGYRRRKGSGSAVAGDIEKLPFETGSFDLAFATYVLGYYPYETGKKMLAELARSAKQVFVYPGWKSYERMADELELRFDIFKPRLFDKKNRVLLKKIPHRFWPAVLVDLLLPSDTIRVFV